MPAEAANAGHAFALVLVDELVRHGTTDAVVSPGSRSTPVALALANDDRIRLHVRIDERSASFVALGLAKASDRVVPVLCTSGTAAAHFLAAALEADQSCVPLLLLTADRPPELRGVGANQTIDQVDLYGRAVRWSADLGVPEARPDAVRYWRSVVSRAAAIASGRLGPPPGPVHLNLPLREPLTPVDDATGFPYSLAGRPDGAAWTVAAAASPQSLPAAVETQLLAARRGVIVAGDGLSSGDAEAVVALAAARNWPLIAEPHSNARRGPHALRSTDALLRDAAFVAAHRPDFVVVAGRIGLSRAVLGWVAQQPTVVVDPAGRWIDPTRTAATLVAASPAALAAVGGPPADDEWMAGWRDAAQAAGAAVDGVLDEPGGGDAQLTEPLVARELAAAVPEGGVLVVASSMPIRDLDLTMRPRDGVRVLANRGVSGIDGFVSTAVGIALAETGPTLALAGDLSMLHDVNGFVVRDGHRLDLTLVVVDNDGGGIFSLLPHFAATAASGGAEAPTFETLFGTPHGVDLTAVAAGYGVPTTEVTTVTELRDAVAAGGGGIRLLLVRTNRAANAALHRRLAAEGAAAVAASIVTAS